MKLNRFVMQAQQKKNTSLFHSSGVVQNDGLGAVSTQSFAQRRQVEQNRKIIGGYDRAQVNTAPVTELRARSTVSLSASEHGTSTADVKRRASSQVTNSSTERSLGSPRARASSQIAASHSSGRAATTPRPVFRTSSYR